MWLHIIGQVPGPDAGLPSAWSVVPSSLTPRHPPVASSSTAAKAARLRGRNLHFVGVMASAPLSPAVQALDRVAFDLEVLFGPVAVRPRARVLIRCRAGCVGVLRAVVRTPVAEAMPSEATCISLTEKCNVAGAGGGHSISNESSRAKLVIGENIPATVPMLSRFRGVASSMRLRFR